MKGKGFEVEPIGIKTTRELKSLVIPAIGLSIRCLILRLNTEVPRIHLIHQPNHAERLNFLLFKECLKTGWPTDPNPTIGGEYFLIRVEVIEIDDIGPKFNS